MLRALILVALVALVAGLGNPESSLGRDEPNSSGKFAASKLSSVSLDPGAIGNTGGMFSKVQIERFRCSSAGDPALYVDISCNVSALGQDFAPDNEIAIAVDPKDPNHLLAGSNDYYYRFNNSTGTRQAIVPTGFFTSFDGGATWIDGQIPMLSGNGAGDPVPAFDAKHDIALMAQIENTRGLEGDLVAQGDVSVSLSRDGGVQWSEPVTVMMGTGTGIGPASRAVFWDKEWLAVDNDPASPWYGRAYLSATRLLNGLRGNLAESAIYLSYSDDGGETWSAPKEISGSHPSCTFQSSPPLDSTECDEDQFSIPEVASGGKLYVQFLNGQNAAGWEVAHDADDQVMVVSSTDGGVTFSNPVPVAQLENGQSDMPYSVVGRQTVWGHQIRWNAAGNISVNLNDPDEVTVVFADRGTANPNATDGCFLTSARELNIGIAPAYDPCDAGPGTDTNIYMVQSTDGGVTWSGRILVDDGGSDSQWFPWVEYKSDGSLAIAWDEDTAPAPADSFVHVLWEEGADKQTLGPVEQVDISVTHWSGQYVSQPNWPAACGPASYVDPPVVDADGKDCNVFYGDYTGLTVDSLDRVHVVWTGLNRVATSPQTDAYTGGLHDGYAQDAMYARR